MTLAFAPTMGRVEEQVNQIMERAFEGDPAMLERTTGLTDPNNLLTSRDMFGLLMSVCAGLQDAIRVLAREIDDLNGS